MKKIKDILITNDEGLVVKMPLIDPKTGNQSIDGNKQPILKDAHVSDMLEDVMSNVKCANAQEAYNARDIRRSAKASHDGYFQLTDAHYSWLMGDEDPETNKRKGGVLAQVGPMMYNIHYCALEEAILAADVHEELVKEQKATSKNKNK